MVSRNPHIRLSPEFILAILFLSFLILRIVVNADSLRIDYMGNIFRVGVVPWSDAKHWAEGAIQVLNGEPISGVATARPLYPLWLSVLFFLVGSSYLGAIYAQMIVSAAVLMVAYHLLKPVSERQSVWLFMGFLVIWRPESATVFITENLGIQVLILSFALLWRGMSQGCEKTTLSGAFLLGVSQAVRPWCVMALVTVPFFSFASTGSIKEKVRSFALHVLIISLGFGLHPLAMGIFNKPGQGYANNPQTLYGQVAGGKGWTAVYNDPAIKKALEANRTADEVNRIIYRRIKERFLENPRNLLKAIISGYVYYFRSIPDEFGRARLHPILFILVFLLLVLLERGLPSREGWNSLKRRPIHLFAWLAVFILFYYTYHWTWTILSLAGIIALAVTFKQKFSLFLLLFFIGVLLSIPLVGKDGGLRVKIGGDILLYLTAAVGLGRLLKTRLFSRPSSSTPAKDPIYRMGKGHPIGIISGTIVLFLVIPYTVSMSHHRQAGNRALDELSPQDIGTRLHAAVIPMGPEDLNHLWHAWPDPSFETMDGRMVYYSVRYTRQDVLPFDKGRGISQMGFNGRSLHWPLLPMNIKRTVMIRETWYTLFPGVSLEDLDEYENRRIIVAGNIMARPRRFLHATPFVLITSHIISTDPSGNIVVRKL